MHKTKAQEAGELYATGRKAVANGEHELWMLAAHIPLMISGTRDFDGPLWREREIPPEGKMVSLDRFEDYLLKPARDGLGIESLYQLRSVLEATVGGDKALALVRQEIPDFDKRADGDRAKLAARKGAVLEHGSNQHGGADNVRSTDYGNSSEYTIRRLLKEDRQDLVKQITAGTLSPNKAAQIAGFRKPFKSIPVDSPQNAVTALLRVFTRDELNEAIQCHQQ